MTNSGGLGEGNFRKVQDESGKLFLELSLLLTGNNVKDILIYMRN